MNITGKTIRIILAIGIIALSHSYQPDSVHAAGTCGTGTWTSGNLEIHHINIGQGDATLIVGPTGKSLLFDAGESYWNSSIDARTIGPYIQAVLGCKKLDYVVISHFHLDHIGYVNYGGLWHLVENQGFSVGTTLLRDYNNYLGSTSGTFNNWKTYLEGTGQAKLHPVTALEGTSQVNLGTGVVFDIVTVDGNDTIIAGDFSGEASPPSENDYSIGAVLSYGNFDEWIGGDLDGQYQTSGFGYTYHDIEWSVAPEVGDVDVYRVNHHGSSHSTSETFINQLDPEVSIISVGDANTYGHPTQTVMNRLLATSTVYLTERGDTGTNIGAAIVAGNIVIKTSDGTTYTVNGTTYTANEPTRTDADGDGYFAEADPADNNFTSIPSPNGGCGPTYQICTILSWVSSITRADPSPTSADSVDFTVNFTGLVAGVNSSDFSLTTTGGISGASISGVSGTGDTYTVSVDTGSGNGTIRLDLIDNDSIVGVGGTPLGGTGTGNGNFTSGEVYTLDRSLKEIEANIGGDLMGMYYLSEGEEKREYYDFSGGPVVVEGTRGDDIVSAIRLQSFDSASKTLYSFVETMGVPKGSLSHKYYFPTYNNTWPYLNSQIRFGNLASTSTTVRVTIGGTVVWEDVVPGQEERRLYFDVSGGPVIIESLDTTKDIVAAIRLQSFAASKLYSFAETMGIPDHQLTDTYYFPTYNNTWDYLNSQLRFGNLNATPTTVRVTIGDTVVWEDSVPGYEEKRLNFAVSGGPVKVESLDTSKKIVAAIRLQSFDSTSNTLYSFVETMGVPEGSLSHKYTFPTYNNTWPYLNSQIRFGNLETTSTTIRVTIGGTVVWEDVVPGMEEKRLYFDVSGGPVIIESLDPTKDIVAAIRLQSFDSATKTLYSFAETMGIPDHRMTDTYYFPTYNNTWPYLNSQLRFGVP
jgi:beta-lactamase superfamily II metal-dependent hydrolase